jgi:AraC family ethanolamine operon transcriptional activator
LKRARSFIEENARKPLAVRDVCRAAGVSWRTLDYAFREEFGVAPKAYLKATQLNGVRREIRRAEPPVVISDVANRWGFWHMGQFAADYRKLFGELPSETLARVNAGGG